MKKFYALFTIILLLFALAFIVIVVLSTLGLVSEESDLHSINQLPGGLLEYASEVHGGYSFQYNASLVYNEDSSYDSTLLTSLLFENSSSERMLLVGVLPAFMPQDAWMEGACNKENLLAQLKSQEDLNVSEVKSITDRNFEEIESCMAEVTSIQGDVELPLTVALGECDGRLPVYAFTGGQYSLADMELLLETFSC